MAQAREGFCILDECILPGTSASFALPVPGQSSYTPISMPVHVVHGKRDGPVLFVSAAIHGDEINGIEIIRQLRHHRAMKGLRGTLICIPIVNVYGFLHRTRYLPDRRDLNRSFPGSRNGSLAARMARTFADEVVKRSTFGIDLHTGSNHRENLPHIRADLGNETCARLARAFGAPVAINANLRDGSLRQYAMELGLPMLLYEAGEALRFNRVAISAGVRGVLNVMRAIDMLPRRRSGAPPADVIVAQRSEWTRAPRTGLFRPGVQLGDHVRGDQLLGHISDATGDIEVPVKAGCTGVIVGRVNIPVVNEGDALMHIARFDDGAQSERTISSFQDLHLEGLAEGDFA